MKHRTALKRLLGICCSMVLASQAQSQTCEMTSPVAGTNVGPSPTVFTWVGSPGRSNLTVGTLGPGASDIFASDFLAAGTTTITVSGIPSDTQVHVDLICETAVGSDSYIGSSYTYNSDIDADGISNTLDANPTVNDQMTTFTESEYILNILGSGRVASIESKALFDATSVDMNYDEATNIAKILYQKMKDEFDFIMLVSNQPGVQGDYFGLFWGSKFSVQGLGPLPSDETGAFGSGGKLSGVIHFPFITGLSSGPSLHEIMHNWGNYTQSIPSNTPGHWGASNVGGQLGGWKPGSLVSLGNNEYQAAGIDGVVGNWGGFANGGNSVPYSNFELYLMGLISAEEVGHDIKIANGTAAVASKPGVFSATNIDTVTMQNVIEIDGPRVPNNRQSQNSFRTLFVILTDRALTLSEWMQADEEVYNFALQGDNGSSTFNFWEATGGRASMQFDNLQLAIKPTDQQTNVSVPDAPTPPSLTPGVDSETTVQMNWASIEGVTSYQVFRCFDTATTSCGEPIASVSEPSFVDSEGAAGSWYFYRLKACNNAGCGGLSDALVALRGILAAPSFGNSRLNLPMLSVDSAGISTYYAAVLELSSSGVNNDFTIMSVTQVGEPGFSGQPSFDASTGMLNVPELTVGGVRYSVQLQLIQSSPQVVFRVVSATVQ